VGAASSREYRSSIVLPSFIAAGSWARIRYFSYCDPLCGLTNIPATAYQQNAGDFIHPGRDPIDRSSPLCKNNS